MESKNQWRLILGVIFAFFLLISIFILIYYPPSSFLNFIVRLGALWGFIGLCFTSIMNLNKRILFQKFGLKFMKLHHSLGIFSLIMTSLHPIAFAIDRMSLLVFLPDLTSWISFWTLAGRPALILIYIAVIAAVLRKQAKKSWRYFHILIYIALIFIFVHAILIGTDFQNIFIIIMFSFLIFGVCLTFILLRIEKHQRKKKLKKPN